MAKKRIKDLNNEATASTLLDNQYVAVDGSTGTFKTKLSEIATWIHNKWAAFVNALTATTSFASGDKIPVVNGSTATAMEASKLLELTAQNALAGNVAQEFDSTRTSENQYLAGESVVYQTRVYTFKVNHYGAWDATHVQETDEFWRMSFPRDAYEDGYIRNDGTFIGDVTASAFTISLKVGCTPGQKFYVRGIISGNVSRLWCTFDDYGVIKRRGAANLDTRNDPLIITVQDGETGVAFNVTKGQRYFIACSVPNFVGATSSKLAKTSFELSKNSANTPIPYKKVLENKYVNSTGVVANDNNFRVYEFELNPSSIVHVKTGVGGGKIAFYDDQDSVVDTPFGDNSYAERVYYGVSVPSTAVLLRVTCAKTSGGVNQVPSVMSLDGFGMSKLLDLHKHIFAGKKILCIGDSITEAGTWFDTLLEKTGASQIWNRGSSGTTLASFEGSTHSMCDRADMESDDVESHHNGGFPSAENVDVIIIWGGTNDFGNEGYGVQFGTEVKYNKMYFLSAVLYLINKVKAKYPTKPVYVCGIMTAQKPGVGGWNRYAVSYGVYTERTNWTGKTITDYNASIKQICSMTGAHYIDMEMCGISPVINSDYENYFQVDGLHPNSAGGVRIGNFIAENLVYDS